MTILTNLQIGLRGVRGVPIPRWDVATLAGTLRVQDGVGRSRLTQQLSITSNGTHVQAVQSFAAGKVYWEVRVVDKIAGTTGTTGVGLQRASATGYLGQDTLAYGWWPQGSIFFNNAVAATVATYVQGDVLQFAIDAGIGSMWFGKNGTFTGNPAAGTGASITGAATGVAWKPATTPWSSDAGHWVIHELVDRNAPVHSVPSGFTYLQ